MCFKNNNGDNDKCKYEFKKKETMIFLILSKEYVRSRDVHMNIEYATLNIEKEIFGPYQVTHW